MQHESINHFVIVGGGTAGWMSAAALARVVGTKTCHVTLVESAEIGTVGVGEATIPPILEFNRLLGIDADDMLKATCGTFKLGIEFTNWGKIGDVYMHPFGVFGRPINNVNLWHYWKKASDLGLSPGLEAYSMNAMAAWQNKFCRSANLHGSPIGKVPHAYHFDAGLYAEYLREYSTKLGVKRIEGTVKHVQQDSQSGFIKGIELQDGHVIEGDFFIDCTGFRGLLIEECLQTGYEEWAHYLPCNSAFAAPSQVSRPLHPYTKAIAHPFGWQWRIPLQHRTGNGLVYCNDFVSDEEAARTLMDNLTTPALAEPRKLRFVTGKRKKTWNKNCLAVGLSSGFMEPLESTSIHLIQSAIFKFFSLFPRRDGFHAEMDYFNNSMDKEMRGIRDFLILHYKATQRDDSEFWEYCRNMMIPDSLQEKLELYQAGSWLVRDRQELFAEPSWLAVLNGQHVKADGYSPLVDIMPSTKVEDILRDTRKGIQECVSTMLDHEAYINRHCGITQDNAQ